MKISPVTKFVASGFMTLALLSGSTVIADHFTPEAMQRLVDRQGGIDGYQQDIANKTNRIYPAGIGDHLIGLSVEAKSESLYYRTELINAELANLDSEALANELGFANAEGTCDNPATGALIVGYDAEYHFDVYSESGELLTTYVYNRQTCPEYLDDFHE